MYLRHSWGLSRAAVLWLSCAAGLSQTFTLSGYVVDGLTNRPMPGIKVHIYEWAGNDPRPMGSQGPAVDAVTSDAEGRFAFHRLASGNYILQAELAHEIYGYSGESADPLGRNAIPVSPESEGREIVFRILPRATISGTVRDENGEPFHSTGVQAYRRDQRGGRIGWMLASSRENAPPTDDRGHYEITDLWPGDYMICAEPPEPWPTYFVPAGESETAYHPGGETRIYVESCYPGAGSSQRYLHISAGARQQLDLKLRSASSVTVRAHVPGQLYQIDPRALRSVRGEIDEGEHGESAIPNVPPGEYVFERYLGDGQYGQKGHQGSIVRQRVRIADKPVTIDAPAEPLGSIEIYLHESDGRVLGGYSANMEERLAVLRQVLVFPVASTRFLELSPDPFSLDPGEYWLWIRPKAPFCAISTALAGGTLSNGKLTVTPGMDARLDVTLGTSCGTLEIHARLGADPAPFANYLLLVNGTPQEPGDVITGSMDARGQALIPRLSPGHYLLWAWVPDGDGYLGPDLAQDAARAVEVVVTAGQPTSASIEPVRPGGGPK